MPVIIKSNIEAGNVSVYFDKINDKIKAQLRETIEKLCVRLTAKIKEEKLSGQVLKVRTGNLRRSISYRINEQDGSVTGIVGTNVEYAPIHEYGFRGTVNVREHIRNMTQAFGIPVAPIAVLVRAHARQVNMPARSFARSALDELQPQISQDFNDLVRKALNK